MWKIAAGFPGQEEKQTLSITTSKHRQRANDTNKERTSQIYETYSQEG